MDRQETSQDGGTLLNCDVIHQLSEEDRAGLTEAVERLNREGAEAAPRLDDMPTLSRFLPKLDMSAGADACWMWTGAASGAGYPQFRVGGVSVGAHLLMCEFAAGERPNGRVSRHACGEPMCANPAHLAFGSQAENSAEAIAHGTRPGLTDERVAEFRTAMIARPELSYRDLGAMFGIHQNTAWRIGTGRSRNPLRAAAAHTALAA